MPRRFPRPIIKSDKHEITWSNLAQNASTVQSVTLSQGVPTADVDTSIETEIGSRITSIYFEFHFSPEVITNPKVIHWVINAGIQQGETLTVPSLYYQGDRSKIIKRGMEMLPKDLSTVFKRIFVVRIPKIYQRVKANSFIQFRYICSSTQTINACGIAIYKEYS